MSNERSEELLTWLDSAYIAKILNKHTSNQLKDLLIYSKSSATKKLENYGSFMHLLEVEYTVTNDPETVRKDSFIIKSRSENELMSKLDDFYNIFIRESQVYNVIMDEANTLLRSIGDDTIFGPRPIYVDDKVIVQENLRLSGYTIDDVKQGLNFEQCQMVLKKLAKFHAVSMVLYKKNSNMFKCHLPGTVSEHPSPLHNLYKNTIKSCIEYCQSQPNLAEYADRLKPFSEMIVPKMINAFTRNQMDRFHVLNHGDIWVNNIMFQRNESGELQDVLFVDYQEGFYGSPGIDLNYFVFSSWQAEVFQNRRMELLAYYHNILSDVLIKLNYDLRIPTIEDVTKEIVNKGFHGLTTATCLLPLLINEHEELADLAYFISETNEWHDVLRKIYDNPRYGARLELYLKFFVEKGLL